MAFNYNNNCCYPQCLTCQFARMVAQFCHNGGLKILKHFDADTGTLQLPADFWLQFELSGHEAFPNSSTSSTDDWQSAVSQLDDSINNEVSASKKGYLALEDSWPDFENGLAVRTRTSTNRRRSINSRRRSTRRSSLRVSAVLNYAAGGETFQTDDTVIIETPTVAPPVKQKKIRSQIPIPVIKKSVNTTTEADTTGDSNCSLDVSGNKKCRPTSVSVPTRAWPRLSITNFYARKRPNINGNSCPAGPALATVTNKPKPKSGHNHNNCLKRMSGRFCSSTPKVFAPKSKP